MQLAFYHLLSTPLERAFPKLADKATAAGYRLLVRCRDAAQAKQLDDLLWTYDPDSFLPHSLIDAAEAAASPVVLAAGEGEEKPNDANLLVILDGSTAPTEGFERVIDLFDGNDPEAVTAARSRWKQYQKLGLTPVYYRQTEQGGWQQG